MAPLPEEQDGVANADEAPQDANTELPVDENKDPEQDNKDDGAARRKIVEEFKAKILQAAAAARRPESDALFAFTMCVRKLADDNDVHKELRKVLPKICEERMVYFMGIRKVEVPAPSPPEDKDEQHRINGRVKSYNTRKGFGFIDAPGVSKDIFVYNAHLIGRIGLTAGESVSFVLLWDEDRPQARQVRVIPTPQGQPERAVGTKLPLPNMINLSKENPLSAMKQSMMQPPTGPSMREMYLAMAAAAAEVPTTLPSQQQGSQQDVPRALYQRVREAQSAAAADKTQNRGGSFGDWQGMDTGPDGPVSSGGAGPTQGSNNPMQNIALRKSAAEALQRFGHGMPPNAQSSANQWPGMPQNMGMGLGGLSAAAGKGQGPGGPMTSGNSAFQSRDGFGAPPGSMGGRPPQQRDLQMGGPAAPSMSLSAPHQQSRGQEPAQSPLEAMLNSALGPRGASTGPMNAGRSGGPMDRSADSTDPLRRGAQPLIPPSQGQRQAGVPPRNATGPGGMGGSRTGTSLEYLAGAAGAGCGARPPMTGPSRSSTGLLGGPASQQAMPKSSSLPLGTGSNTRGRETNEGRIGQRWRVLSSKDFCDVIVRETQEVTSRELRRILPGEVCIQRGPSIALPSEIVRMPIEPDGWVTVHARHIGGPSFMDEIDPREASQSTGNIKAAAAITAAIGLQPSQNTQAASAIAAAIGIPKASPTRPPQSHSPDRALHRDALGPPGRRAPNSISVAPPLQESGKSRDDDPWARTEDPWARPGGLGRPGLLESRPSAAQAAESTSQWGPGLAPNVGGPTYSRADMLRCRGPVKEAFADSPEPRTIRMLHVPAGEGGAVRERRHRDRDRERDREQRDRGGDDDMENLFMTTGSGARDTTPFRGGQQPSSATASATVRAPGAANIPTPALAPGASQGKVGAAGESSEEKKANCPTQ